MLQKKLGCELWFTLLLEWVHNVLLTFWFTDWVFIVTKVWLVRVPMWHSLSTVSVTSCCLLIWLTVISRLQGTSAYEMHPSKFASELRKCSHKAHKLIRTWYVASFIEDEQCWSYFRHRSRWYMSATQFSSAARLELKSRLLPCSFVCVLVSVHFIFGFLAKCFTLESADAAICWQYD